MSLDSSLLMGGSRLKSAAGMTECRGDFSMAPLVVNGAKLFSFPHLSNSVSQPAELIYHDDHYGAEKKFSCPGIFFRPNCHYVKRECDIGLKSMTYVFSKVIVSL